MDATGIVRCAGGLRVAQRGASAADADLAVAPVAPVRLPTGRPIEAQRKDGVVWRRHWTVGQNLLIELVAVANVAVDREAGTITFDRPLDDELEQHLLFDHVLPLVFACDGHLVLHGAVIARGNDGLALVGATGAGKSTLTAFAWQRGWNVGGDDGALIHPGDPPRVEPTYATVRLTPAAAALVGIDPEGCSPIVGKLRVRPSDDTAFRPDPVDLRAIVVVEPAPASGSATLLPLTGMDAHTRLFAAAFHADLSAEARLPHVLTRIAAIVGQVPVARLSVPRGRDGLEAAEGSLALLLSDGFASAVRLDDAS